MTVALVVAGAVAGVIADRLWDRTSQYLTATRPAGKLWGWVPPDTPLQIVVSTASEEPAEYTSTVSPTEARAAAEIESYLASTLHRRVRQRLADGLIDNVSEALALIGGPEKNVLTRHVLKMVDLPVHFDGYTIVESATGRRWCATVEERGGRDRVSEDYGLIVRISNPFDEKAGAIVIAGSRTYGTLAAARALLQDHIGETLSHVRGLGPHFALLIAAPVYDDDPGAPRIVKCWSLA